MYKDWVRYENILLGDKVHFCVRGVRGYCKRMLGNDLGKILVVLVLGWVVFGCISGILPKKRSNVDQEDFKKCLRNHFVIKKKRFRQRWLWVEKIKGYLLFQVTHRRKSIYS